MIFGCENEFYAPKWPLKNRELMIKNGILRYPDLPPENRLYMDAPQRRRPCVFGVMFLCCLGGRKDSGVACFLEKYEMDGYIMDGWLYNI
jgi:hypothetical protein